MPKRQRRNLIGVWFECIEPGVWRSECGWYEIRRQYKDHWVGIDLETGKKHYTSSGMGSAVWSLLGMTYQKWKEQRSSGK